MRNVFVGIIHVSCGVFARLEHVDDFVDETDSVTHRQHHARLL